MSTPSVAPTQYLGPEFRFFPLGGAQPGDEAFEGGALDVARNVDVVFGGATDNSGGVRGDTWTWDGYSWTQMSPATSPSARSSAVMVYDTAHSKTVLFGGVNAAGTLLNDTWLWDGTTWTQQFPTTSPSVRRDATATYIGGTTSKVMLFGGRNSTVDLGDTWEWTGTNWSLITTTGTPAIRSESTMAYSPLLNQVVMFGGESATSGVLDDTWTFSGSTWTSQSPASYPDARRGATMVYNASLSTLQLIGGRDDSGDFFNDVYGWTGTDWVTFIAPIDIGPDSNGVAMLPPTAATNAPATGQFFFLGGLAGYDGLPHGGIVSYDWSAYGDRPEYDSDRTALSDNTALVVNRGLPVAQLDVTDITLAGVSGPFTVGRFYNPYMWANTKMLPNGWVFGTGADLRLSDMPDGGKLLLNENGSELYFDWNGSAFVTPAGIDATLSTISGGFKLTYNSSGRTLTFTGDVLVSDADRDGNAVTFTYDGSGNLTLITDTEGHTLTFAYNYEGLVGTITDNTSRVWTYGYSGWSLTSVTDPAGETTSYDYPGGNDITITTPDGNKTEVTYTWNTISVTRITNLIADTGLTTTYTSDQGTVTGSKMSMTVTDPLGHNTIYEDDWMTHPVQRTDANGYLRKTTYDAHSNPLTTQGDASSSVFTYAYDTNNRLTSATAPPSTTGNTAAKSSTFYGLSTTFPYRPTSGTDPQGNCTAATYNPAGDIDQLNTGVTPGGSTGCDGATTSGTTLKFKRQGDTGVTSCSGKTGQVCQTVDGNGNTTTNTYNTSGQLITVTPPSPAGATSILYDTVGRVAKVTDGAGRVTRTSYDNQDRVTQILYNNTTTCATGHVNCLTYVYDGNGRITSRVSDQGTTSYTYDALGRLTLTAIPGTFTNVCSGTSGLANTYDDASNLSTYCDAQGTVTYRYDNANQLTSLQEPGGNCTATPVTGACTTFAYLDGTGGFHDGRITKITYPLGTGVVTTYTYDKAENLTGISTMKGATALQTAAYTWTNGTVDKTVKQSQTVNSATLYYLYDTFDQLCWASPTLPMTPTCGSPPTSSYAYTYDAAGNRTSEKNTAGTTTSYAFNADNELCKSVTTGTPTCTTPNYTYDASGNRLTGPSSPTWTYNAKDQAASYTPPSLSTVNIAYHDSDSTQQATIGATSFSTSPLGLAADHTTSQTTGYTRTPQGRLISQRVSSTPLYYITDDLGSIIGTFNTSGTKTRDYTYDPLGRALTATGSGVTSNYRFAAGYYLSDINTYKYGTRYYDPNNSGTWTQPDPSGQDLNPYTYAGGNPTNNTDPTGLTTETWSIPCGAGERLSAVVEVFTYAPFSRANYTVSWASRNAVGEFFGSARLLGGADFLTIRTPGAPAITPLALTIDVSHGWVNFIVAACI